MDDFTADELQRAQAPIASLISKSEKAQQKVAPDTWQHTMLRDNLKALHIGASLMGMEPQHEETGFAPDDLREALVAFASMIDRTQTAQQKFSPGTSQYSLLHNRLNALRVAETLTRATLDRR